MKIYQLLIVPFDSELEFGDLRDMVRLPNPVFASLEEAQAAAQEDVNELLAEEDALVLADDLAWKVRQATEAGMEWVASSEDVAMTYAIVEQELSGGPSRA